MKKKRQAVLLLICLIVLAPCILIGWRYICLEQYRQEFEPLLDRARTIMDGTADPAPSEELDGELYFWSWNRRRNAYPHVSYVEVTPIKITATQYTGNEAILTINFEITAHSKNGSIEMNALYSADKWYVRKNGDRWVVYKIETSP